jgi:hypothetical protein
MEFDLVGATALRTAFVLYDLCHWGIRKDPPVLLIPQWQERQTRRNDEKAFKRIRQKGWAETKAQDRSP